MKNKFLISNIGKFHHFELARELYKLNQLSKIICGYPWFKLKNEGLPKNKIVSNSLNTILTRYLFDGALKDFFNIQQCKKIDFTASQYLDDADVFLGLSGSGLETGIKAKKLGKLYVCERSSTHIKFQNEILKNEYEKLKIKWRKINNWFIERELNEYEKADFILVPSNFVQKTFIEQGINKTHVLNFGSWSSKFYPINGINKNHRNFDITFVGQLSVQKGLHILLDKFNKIKYKNKKLHIIGSKTRDFELIKNKIEINECDVKFYGHKTHEEINTILNKSDLFILPSIQEGMASVILQSISAGCPVLITENTGAKELVEKYNCGIVIKLSEINLIPEIVLDLIENKNKLRLLRENTKKLSLENSWENYASKLNKLVNNFIINKQ